MSWGLVQTSVEDRLQAILEECDYLLEAPLDEDDAREMVRDYRQRVESAYVHRWGRWHEGEFGPSYLADEAEARARAFLPDFDWKG